RRDAQRAALERLGNERAHPRYFVVGGFALDALLAHHSVAHGDVADEPADVDADAPLEPVQVVAVAAPAPGDTRHQRLARHGLDAHEALDQRVLAARLDGGEGQPAVAHDDGGHTVLRL